MITILTLLVLISNRGDYVDLICIREADRNRLRATYVETEVRQGVDADPGWAYQPSQK